MRRAILALICVTLLAPGCGSMPPAANWAHVDTGVDPGAWVRVPAGEFLMGIHETPTMIAYAFEIMATPATNAQYAAYLNNALAKDSVRISGDQVIGPYPGDPYTGRRHEEEIAAGDYPHIQLDSPDLRLTYDGKKFGVTPGYENHPMTAVTWFGALAYCQFTGGRLPTETEWEKAARGGGEDNRPYPWGSGILPEHANYYNSGDPFEQVAGPGGDTTPAGYYSGKSHDGFQTQDARSPYGLYDAAGNVWQWTGNLVEGIHDRYMRGGSKANYEYDLRVYSRNSARPDYYGPSVGFRCLREVR